MHRTTHTSRQTLPPLLPNNANLSKMLTKPVLKKEPKFQITAILQILKNMLST